MSQRRELETRLELYEDLSGILGAMRSFSLAELRRVSRAEQEQQQVVEAIAAALDDLAHALPPPPSAMPPDVWVLLGSVRGFCGGFNEEVVHAWREHGATLPNTIVVGERLAGLMPENYAIMHPVDGAEGAQDAPQTIDRILAKLAGIDAASGYAAGLVVCLRDEEKICVERLLPLTPSNAIDKPVLTNEPMSRTATEVARHHLFHAMLALLLRSIHAENRFRLLQMENALRHLEKGRDEMLRQRNRLRQEEIIEEIELMAGARR